MWPDGTPPSPRSRGLFDDVATAAMDLGRDMRHCVAPMLEDSPSIREFALAIGIDKTLAWQVHRIATASDPVAILIALPGQAGMVKAMKALQNKGLTTAALEASRVALIGVLDRRGISRARLKAMAAAQPGAHAEQGAIRQLHRRAYEANAAIQGRSIGGIAVAVMLLRAGSAGQMTLVASTMLHRMFRTVVSGPIPIYYRTQAASGPPDEPARPSARTKGSMASLVRHLCSPELEDAHISLTEFTSGEALCYDPPTSSANRVDFAFREIGHGIARQDRARERTQGTAEVPSSIRRNTPLST